MTPAGGFKADLGTKSFILNGGGGSLTTVAGEEGGLEVALTRVIGAGMVGVAGSGGEVGVTGSDGEVGVAGSDVGSRSGLGEDERWRDVSPIMWAALIVAQNIRFE